MKERDNILRILEETLHAINNDNATPLKELSDQTIHAASTSGDPDNITVAVIVYSIGKILSRPDYKSLKGYSAFKKIVGKSLKCAIKDIQNDNDKDFRKDFIVIRKAINKVSGKLRKYIESVFKKAEISKASRIYEHGISAERTSKLLGITLYDLQNYAGETGISEVPLNQTIKVNDRIKMVEDLFKWTKKQ